MNKRQKIIVIKFVAVMVVTALAVITMINFKDWVNRSEAMQAMTDIGQKVLEERNRRGSVPPESYVDSIRGNLPGNVRLGKLHYRARWIDFESTSDEILAYTKKNYHSFLLGKGYVVLRLDGCVEWMEKQEFEKLLSQQQSQMEIETLRK